MSRVIGWVSGGAASAVTCKMAIGKYGLDRVELIYIDTGSEHPDTMRFLDELAGWYGKPIQPVRSSKYADTWAVWSARRFLRGPNGAPCTTELKRGVRSDMAIPADAIQLWGFTTEERKRADTFRRHHYGEMVCEFPLIDASLTKADAHARGDQ